MITPHNSKLLKERYILQKFGNKELLVLMNDSNIKDYIGKEVKLRSPMLCNSKNGICSKCAGELYYQIGIKNVGLITNSAGTALVTLALKKMHDMSVKLKEVDIESFIE